MREVIFHNVCDIKLTNKETGEEALLFTVNKESMLDKVLNKRHGLLKEDIKEVEKEIPNMAKELSKMSFYIEHSDEQLKREWELLKQFGSNEKEFSVRMKLGMKLCEHFFPNFYHIKNPNGKSFASEWNEKTIERTLRAICNGYYDSLYLSTIRSKLYLYAGMTKSTMYRPFLAKVICDYYGAKRVLDPCCGFGGRMLGVVASGAEYIGFEPNEETYTRLIRLAEYLDITDKVTIFNKPAEHMDEVSFEDVDLILTSPPYYDVEIYCGEETQSYWNYSSYIDWCNGWLFDVIKKSQSRLKPNGVSCWNVHNFETRNMPMIDDVRDFQESIGMEEDAQFVLVSHNNTATRRRGGGNRPSSPTIVYKKSGAEVETYEFVAKRRNAIDKIYAYDKETGEFAGEFDNVTEAADYFDMDRGNLYGVIDTDSTRKGHYFKRTYETINILPWICEIEGKRFRTIIEVANEYGITKQAVSIARKRGSKIKGNVVTWKD